MELFGMPKSRSFPLYSSRFEEELASDCKLSTYLGITFIESHRERVKRSLSVVTPLFLFRVWDLYHLAIESSLVKPFFPRPITSDKTIGRSKIKYRREARKTVHFGFCVALEQP